jgi:hypothetical protein
VAILSAAEKAVAPKVVSKMTLDRELTATEQVSTRSAYAAAAEVPVENVELSKGARRQSKVSYSVTVYVKDAAAAAAVSNKLSDPAVVKSALIAAVLLPDHTPLVRLCVCTRRGPSTVTPPFVPPAGSARLRRSSSSSSITFCLSTCLAFFPDSKDLDLTLDLDTERILDDALLPPSGCSYPLLSIVVGLLSRSDYIWNLTNAVALTQRMSKSLSLSFSLLPFCPFLFPRSHTHTHTHTHTHKHTHTQLQIYPKNMQQTRWCLSCRRFFNISQQEPEGGTVFFDIVV